MIYGIVFIAVLAAVILIMMRSTTKELDEVHERAQSYLNLEPQNDDSLETPQTVEEIQR